MTTEQHLDALIDTGATYGTGSREGNDTLSICLLDQVRAIGAERVHGYPGNLDAEQYRPIHDGLREMMSHDGGDAPEQTTESAD